ncbi:magnesium-transporting ATPase (P-type) [Bradyrhizobium sp. F1.4.3]|uniref:hypothetical protein n=1 Tax=Bradyrhizobium sp. F1.4.3 TaxID=3156356 RepID=UPI003396A52A
MSEPSWYSVAQASSVAGCTFGVTCIQSMIRRLGLDSIWVPFILAVIFVSAFVADWTQIRWLGTWVVVIVNVAVVFLGAVGANESAANIKNPQKGTGQLNRAGPKVWIRSYFRHV